MHIEQAIELISEYVNREDFYQVRSETQAMILGIEALKAWERIRILATSQQLWKLPGETERIDNEREREQ